MVISPSEIKSKLGELAALSQKDIGILQIAVLYHDLGLPDGREGHEERSAEIAEDDLKAFGYPDEDINSVKQIVLGTKGEMQDAVYVTEPST